MNLVDTVDTHTHTLGPSMSSSHFSIHKNMCVSLSSQTRPQSCTVSKLSVSRVSTRSNLSLRILFSLTPCLFIFHSLFFWLCLFPICLFPLYNLFQLCHFYWLAKDHIKSQMEGNIIGLLSENSLTILFDLTRTNSYDFSNS